MYYLENLFSKDEEDEIEIDLDFIEKLLHYGVDINFCDSINENALFKVYKILNQTK